MSLTVINAAITIYPVSGHTAEGNEQYSDTGVEYNCFFLAEKKERTLSGTDMLTTVYDGVAYVDGIVAAQPGDRAVVSHTSTAMQTYDMTGVVVEVFPVDGGHTQITEIKIKRGV